MKFILLMITIFIISACWKPEPENTWENNKTQSWTNIETPKSWSWFSQWSQKTGKNDRGSKQKSNDFNIEVKNIWELWDNYSIQKVWQILPNQSLKINAQVSGNIWSMSVKEWDQVLQGQLLVSMSDNFSKYSLDLEKAQIDYDRQIIGKDSQLLSIEKNINDIKRNLDDSSRIYNNALINAEEKKKIALINFKNADTKDTNSKAYLELEKSKLSYENLLNTNKQTLSSYIRDVQKEYNELYVNLSNIIEFWEDLYWNKNGNDDLADKIKSYFWARDTGQKYETKEFLWELITYNTYLQSIDPDNIDGENIIEFMITYRDGYEAINKILNSLDITLNNSIISLWILSESDIDGFISKVNSFQSSNQSDLSSYNSLLKSISNFLETYEDGELIWLKNLKISMKNFEDWESNSDSDYKRELISIENELASVKKSYDTLQANYDNLLLSKDVDIRSLDNSISSARNNLKKAQVEFNKLRVYSPISWIIQSIEVDKWQNISAGTQIISLISNDITKIDVSVSKQEIETINTWDIVKIEYGTKTYEWKVFTISRIADKALNYNVQITLNENIWLIWWSAKVFFQKEVSNLNLPLNVIDIVWDDIWTINTLWEENILEVIKVTLWKISGNNIEITSTLPDNIQIITTDMSNYNPSIQKLNITNK